MVTFSLTHKGNSPIFLLRKSNVLSTTKDRTGVLAALLLSILGVGDKYIVDDYILTAHYMKDFYTRLISEPNTPEEVKNLPGYTWEASKESMYLFLSGIKNKYGSAKDYIKTHGGKQSLFNNLEKALLV